MLVEHCDTIWLRAHSKSVTEPISDSDERYSSDKLYRLHLQAPNFWSLTLYDALTASGLDNGQPFPSLNSHDRPLVNADGSVDLYVGPSSPPGKEANWLKTVPGKGYFTILRLYSPTEAYLDGTWKANDLEEIH